ncbi:DUF2388 domain-containing protein [Bdellovibrio sp. HCB2-146]|uniref:DUF2388 domain-containing protein n=1 Tax=Bdellovibrio sp. HCB2-146 TaxID=3394362 RepID=UPI0039BCB225
MKKSLIVLSVVALGLNAFAQEQGGGIEAAGSFSRPTQTISNLPWATEQAMNELKLDPTLALTAPTLTTLIATHRDTELQKVVKMAGDDAASYVASEGRVKGAYLEQALKVIREMSNTKESDAVLAKEILLVNVAIGR